MDRTPDTNPGDYLVERELYRICVDENAVELKFDPRISLIVSNSFSLQKLGANVQLDFPMNASQPQMSWLFEQLGSAVSSVEFEYMSKLEIVFKTGTCMRFVAEGPEHVKLCLDGSIIVLIG